MIKILKYLIIIVLVFEVNAQNQKPPKNVLFIMVDDLRPELKVYNKNYIKSPNIDQLASEGVTFNRAYFAVKAVVTSKVF